MLDWLFLDLIFFYFKKTSKTGSSEIQKKQCPYEKKRFKIKILLVLYAFVYFAQTLYI